MALTANTTCFARHYLVAVEFLLESIAAPGQYGFETAYGEAQAAKSDAHGTTEIILAQTLMAEIRTAAQHFGYTVRVS